MSESTNSAISAKSNISIGLLLSLIACGSGFHAWNMAGINARLDRVEAKVDAILLKQQMARMVPDHTPLAAK